MSGHYYAHPKRFCVVQENIKPGVLKVRTELAMLRQQWLHARPTNILALRSALNEGFGNSYYRLTIYRLRVSAPSDIFLKANLEQWKLI